jgi:hypothetical protein
MEKANTMAVESADNRGRQPAPANDSYDAAQQAP